MKPLLTHSLRIRDTRCGEFWVGCRERFLAPVGDGEMETPLSKHDVVLPCDCGTPHWIGVPRADHAVDHQGISAQCVCIHRHGGC
jgi:hypothetical protein